MGFRTAKRPVKPRLGERENGPRYPPHSILRKVWRNGVTGHRNMAIVVGRRFAGATVRLVEVGELLQTVAPNPDRRYQRMNKPPRRD